MRILLFITSVCLFFNVQAMDKGESFKRVQSQLQNSTSTDISVIVELEDIVDINASENQRLRRSANIKSGLMSRLSRLGAREHKRFRNLPIMALQVDVKGLQELEKNSAVKKVYPNQLRKHLLNSSTVQVQADQAWARNQLGDGVTVAIVDAGFSNFTDMFDAPGKVANEACFTTTANVQGIQVFGNCSPNNSQMRIGPGSASQNCNPCAAGMIMVP